MWVKSENNYLNLDNGQSLIVQESKDQTQHRIMMRSADNVTNLYAVMGGYRTAEDAQEALNTMMSGVDFVEVETPEYEEVVEEDEDDTEEDAEEDD